MTGAIQRAHRLRAQERWITLKIAILAAICFVGLTGALVLSDLVVVRAATLAMGTRIAIGATFVALACGTLLIAGAHVLRLLTRARAERDEARQALVAAQRYATPGLLAASLAHDLNNLLAIVSAGIAELGLDLDRGERAEVLADMNAAAQRGGELARRLSRAGRSGSTEATEVDLVEVVGEAVELLRHHKAARARSIEVIAPREARAVVHPAWVHQIATNLVVNALEASPECGQVRVRVEGDARTGIRIDVEDDGPGVPEALRDVIFDPFFTAKPEGTGLGMLSVRACVEMHNGHVEVGQSEDLGGARIRAVLRAAGRWA